ncbi:TonB-dependent receptor plug domain-containing protein, partial [Sphingomonas bacterium]|uniref:TonB-dependent receptor plug domain-containing protein n=1 Tax=Sphingomonas bacterium TaxID=1895847 RepID=UPI001576D0C1
GALAAAPQEVPPGGTGTRVGSGDGTGEGQASTTGTTDNDIIVTGTRAGGITAAESATPIKVLNAETLSHVGQPNLNQQLAQLVPSFTAESFGGDTANLTLSARLRGLSPNQTLVLVNGKRRHGTANLHVLAGPYQGSAAPDLDLIAPESIQRIEVLEDGAAAQYGSDAIAGVINIILKDSTSGIDGNATAGEYYDTGGETYAGTLHVGTKIGAAGYFDATGFYRYNDFTQVGGVDRRVSTPDGALQPSLSAAQRSLYATIPGFEGNKQITGGKFANRINGNAQSYLVTGQYNTGYDFGGFKVYSFGSYSRRVASAFENLRVPDRVIASPVLGVAGTLTTPGELIPFPQGFNPREKIKESDFAFTGGAKGDLGGFGYDLSATYGRDKNVIETVDSVNRSLFVNTHASPRNFYDGFFQASEFTANADFSKPFDIGTGSMLNVAFGAEYRRNTYQIGSGDAGSIYLEGGQSYPGFRPTDAGSHRRDNAAGYIDLATTVMDKLKVDLAGRYEHYSDFGSRVIGKGTARYDIAPTFAIRGTVDSGFRAPTLAEEFYSATNVSPTSATVQLPANSAAAKVLGFQNLRPEKSFGFSFGGVFRPLPKLAITIDAYQTKITDRILGTGTFFNTGGATNYPLVTQAIVANGNILDPTVVQTGISVFTNGGDTRTRGIDATASYDVGLNDLGDLTLSLSANYNKTILTRINAAPTGLPGATLFDKTSQSLLITGSPRVKVTTQGFYTYNAISILVRENFYGSTSAQYSPDGGNYTLNRVGFAAITDIELGVKITKALTFSFGANNLTNKKPPAYVLLPNVGPNGVVNVNQPIVSSGGNVYDAPLGISPYGINGGYYYGRLAFKF